MDSSKRKLTNTAALFGAFVIFFALSLPAPLQAEVNEAIRAKIRKSYFSLPLTFEANRGQTDQTVKFLSRANGYTLFLTPTEAVLGFKAVENESSPNADFETNLPISSSHKRAALRMSFVGANTAPRMFGLEELSGKVNYFYGKNSKSWHSNIPTYAKVRYESLYPGVDVVYYGNHQQLEYDFIVAPGADPKKIRISYTGAEKLEIDPQGDLVIRFDGREIRQHRPVVYQDRDGIRQEIASSYVLRDGCEVTIDVAGYDVNSSLVIDPALTYSTYLGGIGTDQAFGIAVDSAGNAYVTGATSSPDFPTVNTIQPFQHGSSGPFGHSALTDVFVTKFNPAGNALVYSTFIGGGGRDEGHGIVVDSTGNAYVAGTTDSMNFPTLNALQPLNNGSRDGFVLKLNASGSSLVYSTYLGGFSSDELLGLAIDSAGNAYVTGLTASSNFPVVNPIQAFFGGVSDVFVSKLNPDGTQLVYSTYLGGSGIDQGYGIAVDSSGNAYIVGETRSLNFPKVNAIQPTFGGGLVDAFVAKLNAQGSGLVYSTYLGGSDNDYAFSIAVDSLGNAHTVGQTFSSNFPVANAIQPTRMGNSVTAFVTKLNAQGSSFVYSTYLGGGNVVARSVVVDALGDAYVTGSADTVFPIVDPIQESFGGNSDAFITKFNSDGSALLFSSYLGGNFSDTGNGIAVDSNGNVYIAGFTISTIFPTVNALQANCVPQPTAPAFCSGDAFVAKISMSANQAPVANAGPDQTAACAANCIAAVLLDGSNSFDPDGDQLTFTWTGSFGTASGATTSVALPKGSHTITLTVMDPAGNTSSDTVVITVVDSTPPAIGSVTAAPNTLIQANHQMVPVTIGVSVSDNCDAAATCKIISVASNEPVEGLGDGDTSPDWTITGNLTLDVRAERSAHGTGRVYTITIECKDSSGNSSTKTATVSVPRNN